MIVRHGAGTTSYGPGVNVELTGDEVARAIDAYLVAHGIHVDGARTITVNGELCGRGIVFVDPSGFVIDADGTKISGSASPTELPTVKCAECRPYAHLERCKNCGYARET